MRPGDIADQSEADADAAVTSPGVAFDLLEALEDPVQLVCADAHPVVFDRDTQLVGVAADADLHPAPTRLAELEGVGEQVVERGHELRMIDAGPRLGLAGLDDELAWVGAARAEAAGDLAGRDDWAAEGEMDQAEGKVRKGVGKMGEKLDNAIDALKDDDR